MSDLDNQALGGEGATTTAPGQPAVPSRRSVLRGAAGAGAAGIAATTLGGMLAPAAASAAEIQHVAAEDRDARDVVLHVRDAATGEIDVFRGTTQIRLRDRDLAARVVRASR